VLAKALDRNIEFFTTFPVSPLRPDRVLDHKESTAEGVISLAYLLFKQVRKRNRQSSPAKV